MSRFFNTAGPCNREDHYMLPAASRLPDVGRLIAQKGYFVIRAPRQTGKTTAMLELARQLTKSGQHTAALLSMEVGAAFNDDIGAAESAIFAGSLPGSFAGTHGTSLKRAHIPAVSLFFQILPGDEPQGGRVHAISQARRRRSVGE